jgi:hypothetical protein
MLMEDMVPVANFLQAFLNCLSPVPWDRDIESLVRRARSVLMISHMTSMLDEVAVMAQNPEQFMASVNSVGAVLDLMEKWKDFHQESEEARWQRFHLHNLTDDANPDDNKKMSKILLKENKKHVKNTTNLSEGEMCANCYVLEKTLDERLLKCGQCRLIKYCSRECQREHWKKAHKKQCKN